MSITPKPLPPGRLGLPVIGQMPAYLKNPFQFIEDGVADYGPIFKSRLLLQKAVVVTGPDGCRVFNDPQLVERAGAFPLPFQWLFGGRSLPLLDGNAHLLSKETILSAFTPAALDGYLPAMQDLVEAHFRQWVAKGEFRWLDGLKKLAFEVIWTNLFGSTTAQELAQMQSDYESVSAALVSALPLPIPGLPYWRGLQARKRAFAVLSRIVNERKRSRQNDGLSMMLRGKTSAGQSLSTEQMVLEMHHLLLAGFIVFGHLVDSVRFASRPQIQQTLRTAVSGIPRNTRFTVNALGSIHYLQQFIMEVKRLCPILPVLFARAKSDFEFNGVRVPAGWLVIWAVRSTNIYQPSFRNPNDFDPERFRPHPGNVNTLHANFVYVPQSGGPLTGHACAGFDYSALLMSVFLAILLRDHDWQLTHPELDYLWRLNPPQPRDGLLATVT